MLAKRVLRLVSKPTLRPGARRALGGTLAQTLSLTLTRSVTTPSLANFSSSAAAEHVANLPDPSEAFDRIVHRSPHADIEIPSHTIWEEAERQARLNGDKPAFVCGVTHQAVTFRELFAGARRLAASLRRQGLRKGDVVVLHSFNCIEYPMAVLGRATSLQLRGLVVER
jgi:non-ribosomal peptide synthetase component F